MADRMGQIAGYVSVRTPAPQPEMNGGCLATPYGRARWYITKSTTGFVRTAGDAADAGNTAMPINRPYAGIRGLLG